MRSHVIHLLTRYISGQLDKRQRERVIRHVRECASCRAALAQEQALVRDLTTWMPTVGRPAPGQMQRLRSRVFAEAFAAPRRNYLTDRLLPSIGVTLAALLLVAFVFSAMFSSPTEANAAPNQVVPGDVQATNTPVHTDSPDPATEVALALTPPANGRQTAADNPIAAPVPKSYERAR